MKKQQSWCIIGAFCVLICLPQFSFGEDNINLSESYRIGIDRVETTTVITKQNIPAISISGLVTDTEGEPLIGVNIQVKGTTIGTSSDFDGNYTLNNVEEDAILVFSYVGYQKQEVAVDPLKHNLQL